MSSCPVAKARVVPAAAEGPDREGVLISDALKLALSTYAGLSVMVTTALDIRPCLCRHRSRKESKLNSSHLPSQRYPNCISQKEKEKLVLLRIILAPSSAEVSLYVLLVCHISKTLLLCTVAVCT